MIEMGLEVDSVGFICGEMYSNNIVWVVCDYFMLEGDFVRDELDVINGFFNVKLMFVVVGVGVG